MSKAVKAIAKSTIIGGGIFAAVLVVLIGALIGFSPNACESLIMNSKQSDLSARLAAWAETNVFPASFARADIERRRGSNASADWALINPTFSSGNYGGELGGELADETAVFIVPSAYDWADTGQFDDFAAIEFKVAGRRSILVKRPGAPDFGFTPSHVDRMEILTPNVAVICRYRD